MRYVVGRGADRGDHGLRRYLPEPLFERLYFGRPAAPAHAPRRDDPPRPALEAGR